MIKLIAFFCLAFIFSCNDIKDERSDVLKRTHKLPYYSEIVQDSFVLDVYLPDTSVDEASLTYPVVYILDGNLYFEIFASVLKQYNNVGLLPKVILVGVGYPTFQKMDSLRQRDYTYPEAIAEYEMPVSGKADAFRKAFINEFIPVIDNLYPTDSSKRILVGHSLGGYFSIYTMYQEALENTSIWMGYIAASPSLHYNNFYLINKFDSLPKLNNHPRKAFISYGMDEAEDMVNENGVRLDSLLFKSTAIMERTGAVAVKAVSYSSLGHMDTQLPTFIKGLQWMLQDPPNK